MIVSETVTEHVDIPDRMNAATFFVDANVEAGRGAKIAIYDAGDGATYTYDEVLALTNRVGNALKGLGVRREERVMLLLPDSPAFVACFFGAIKIGAVPIPTNTLLKPNDYAYLLSDSRARVLVIGEGLLADNPVTTRNVQELFEPVVVADLNIAVFGAGHVGSAVVSAISGLDCNIRWIDSRRKMFHKVPTNVSAIEASDPVLEVAAMPVDSFYLVMTHSHAMDFDICDRILRRRDARYCGLIGSKSKRRRFEKRYRQQGMPQSLIDQLICPIGVDGISGKKPAEIAVAAAAEILKVRERAVAPVEEDYPDNVRPLWS